MKKVLLSLLAVAALVLSCQNYDDEFDALNAKVASLEGQISSLAGLQAAITDVQTKVSTLATEIGSGSTGLKGQIAEILDDLTALATAVASATTQADLDALQAELDSTLAALQALVEANKTELDALGVDVDSLLANEDPYQGELKITDASELAFAKSLGSKVKSVKGNVTITLSSANGLTAADVDPVVSQITSVIGNVVINTTASINLSALKTVSGLYEVRGKDINDSALVSVGDMYLAYDGPYLMPSLTAAKKIGLVEYDTATGVVGTTSVDFSNVTATSVTSYGSAASGHTSGGSLSVSGVTEGFINFLDATSIKIGDATVIRVDTKDATEISLGFDGTLASLDINDTQATETSEKLVKVFVYAKKITGTLDADMNQTSGELHLPNATQIGALTSDADVHDLSKLVYVGTGTDTDANGTVDADEITGGTLTLTKDESPAFPELVKTGNMTIEDAATLNFPKLKEALVITATDTNTFTASSADITNLDAKDGSSSTTLTIEVASASAALTDRGTVDVLTFTSLDKASSNAGSGVQGFVQAKTITITAEDGTDDGTDLAFTSANAVLETLTINGKASIVSITGAAALETLITGGTIYSLTVDNNDDLDTLTLDHTEDAADGTILVISNNNEVKGFTTKITQAWTFQVTGNEELRSFDASSLVALPADTSADTGYLIEVSGNASQLDNATGNALSKQDGLQGEYTALSSTTAEAFVQSSLVTLKPYALLVANAATATSPTAEGLGAKTSAGRAGTASFIYMNYEYASSSSAHGVAQIGDSSTTAATVKAQLNALN